MKMNDLGVMPKHHMSHTPDCCCGDEQMEKKPNYPSLHLCAENLPEIEKYDVGDVVTLTFQAKVTSKSTDSYMGEGTHVDFKLLKGGCSGSQQEDSEDEPEEDEADEMKSVKSKKLPWDEDSEDETPDQED